MIVQPSQPLQRRNKVICNNVILTCIPIYFLGGREIVYRHNHGYTKMDVSSVKTIQVDGRLRITETVSSTEF